MVIWRRVRLAMLVLGVLFAAASAVRAVPAPTLNAVPPIAIKQGQTLEVAVTGANLAAVASAPVVDARRSQSRTAQIGQARSQSAPIKVTASADAALGDREMRLVGPTGVTKPLHVFVSQYPVIADKEPNNTAEQAQEIELPATLIGRIDTPGDVDQFRFHASKGQTLVFDIDAARNGSPLDAVATIHSADNREMRVSLEHRGGDPVVVFEVPEDGDYRVRLRDLEYRGGGDYDYRIVAGAIPYIESILPSSGEPGQIVTAQAIGYNLEGGDKIPVDLTNSAPGRIEVRAKTSAGFSNSVPFEVTELPAGDRVGAEQRRQVGQADLRAE